MQPRSQPTIHYRTFILTVWEEVNDQQNGITVWRCSLEHPHSAQRIGFKSLTALVRYLQAQIAAQSNSPESNSPESSKGE